MKVFSLMLHVLSASLNSLCVVSGSQHLDSFCSRIENETSRSIPVILGQKVTTVGACTNADCFVSDYPPELDADAN